VNRKTLHQPEIIKQLS